MHVTCESEGIDPIAARDESRAAAMAASARQLTFDACANAYIAAHRSRWKNVKHGPQWSTTLERYASPVFGSVPVQQVDTGLVMRVIEPMWHGKTDTAASRPWSRRKHA